MSHRFLILVSFLTVTWASAVLGQETKPAATQTSWDVREMGATGDGATKDTSAFQKALDACAAAGGGTVTVSRGNYLIGSITLGSNTTLQLARDASLTASPDINDYPLVKIRWEGEFAQGHRALISADGAQNITLSGGWIYGPPLALSHLRNPRGPALIEPMNCTNVTLQNFSTLYEQLWSIHPLLCKHVIARNLTIRSIKDNGDGIDVDSCSDVLIEHCNIDTGDDAISLKSGRGQAAVDLNRPTENVVIRDCFLNDSGFAAIGIGTEMSGGIRNVRIENCVLGGKKDCILIKSREGRGSYMENIHGENLLILNAPYFLSIDLLKKGIQATDPVEGPARWAIVKDISFSNITLHDVGEIASVKNVSPERPVENLTLTNITGTATKGVTLNHVPGAKIESINVSGIDGPLLTKSDDSTTATTQP